MTTGTVYVGRSNDRDFLFYKNWSGGDGKRSLDGSEKWNNYSMYLLQESDQFGQIDYAVSTINGAIPEWTANDEYQLQSRLVELIKGHKFNLAVDLAQANQLVEMCSKTILSFGRALLFLKRGDVSSAMRELGISGRKRKLKSEDVTGRWLELQYGWLPAVGSCYGAAKAFEAISSGRSSRVVATKSYVAHSNASAIPSQYVSARTTFLAKRIVYEMEEEISLSRTLGLTDPFQVAWELIPFSFVADWFLPIGGYLENLAIIPSLKGRFLISEFSRSVSGFTKAIPPDGLRFVGSQRLGQIVTVRRTVSNSLATAFPQFVNPITAMSGKRIANAVSLFHQLTSDGSFVQYR